MKREVQLTNYEPVNYVINTHFGDIDYKIFRQKQMVELMEGNSREFYVKYCDKYSNRTRDVERSCAIFEYKEVSDDDYATESLGIGTNCGIS